MTILIDGVLGQKTEGALAIIEEVEIVVNPKIIINIFEIGAWYPDPIPGRIDILGAKTRMRMNIVEVPT